MKILFEDENIIVCIKPRGIVSQEDSSGRESMISLLSQMTNSQIYPLHRLDKEVGGVMVYAKNKKSAADISRQITDNIFNKEYIALVHGCPDSYSGQMQDLLFKDSKKNKSFVVKRERKGVKSALLEYEITEKYESHSKVLVRLQTGRTHQIRVQFASRKMPLFGDRKYGANDDSKILTLWSYKLNFNHPITKENMIFVNDPDF